MSIEAMKWAMEQTIVRKATDRHVLLVMANNARDDGTAAFPSVHTIATRTGLSERAVRYSLKRLLEAGAIRRGSDLVVAAHIRRADQRPNNYDLAMDDGVQEIHPDKERGAYDDTNGVHMTTERGAPAAPEPSYNHPIEPIPPKSPKRKKRGVPEKPASIADSVWGDFLELRKAKRAPLTATALAGIEREARKAGISLQTALEACCANGWQGFRAEWVTKDAQRETFRERDRRLAAERMAQIAPGVADWSAINGPTIDMEEADVVNAITR